MKLIAHDVKWRNSFKREARKIKKVLGKDALDIQHVGSTAIPGIPAKPIVDIAVFVRSLKKAKRYIRALKKIGYKLKDEKRFDRLFFTKGSESRRTHYLHIGEAGSGYIEDMILFRDYLLKHGRTAKDYAELKKYLAKKYQAKRERYTKKKEKLIKKVVRKARKVA